MTKRYERGKNPNSRNGFKKGNKINVGKKASEETIMKRSGTNNHNWKGDEVGYSCTHDWVRRWKGTPTTCEKCGKENLIGRQIHWANKDHKYRRVLDDYIRLCSKCHRKYDKINNLRK